MRTDRIALFLLGLSVVVGVGGCPGSLDNKDEFLDAGFTAVVSTGADDNCGDVEATILAAKCGGTGCHGTKSPQNNLDLESPGVAARVVGVPAIVCKGTLANPSDPDNSVIYTKVLETTACGARMPLARPVLSAAETECLRLWIAKQGGGTTSSSGGTGGAGGMSGTSSASSSSAASSSASSSSTSSSSAGSSSASSSSAGP